MADFKNIPEIDRAVPSLLMTIWRVASLPNLSAPTRVQCACGEVSEEEKRNT